MYDRLLVPTDGSDPAAAAGEAAVNIASQFGAAIDVVYVEDAEELPFGFDEVPAEFARRTRRAVETIAETAEDAGLETTSVVLELDGPVHETILDYAMDQQADAIVMGTHGRSGIGRAILGSVTEQTIRKSPVPVMSVHAETVTDSDIETVLVPTDGSECAETAVEHGADLAAATDASLHLINVVDLGVVAGDVDAGRVLDALEESGERALEAAIDRAHRREIETVEASVISGTPSRAICDYATETGVDCIVMGTHGRSGLTRLFLGSVTERVIRHGVAPVLTTRPREKAK